jgi:hypothetical protein
MPSQSSPAVKRGGHHSFAIGCLLLLTPATAAAQLLEPPRARQGYYLGASLMSGAARNWSKGDSLGTWRGSAMNLRFGQLLTRRFGLGLQLSFGGSADGPERAAAFGLGLESHLELARNFAAHAGIGLGVLQLTDDREPDEPLRGTVGAEYNVGLSYAWYPLRGRASGGFSITPLVQTRFLPGTSAAGLTFLLGVELGWWTGLPRNQLELPEGEAYQR